MLRCILLTAIVGLACAPMTAGQSFAAQFSLGSIAAPPSALAPGDVVHVSVPWTYLMPNNAVGAEAYAEGKKVHIDFPPPTCDQPGFVLEGPNMQEVPVPPPSGSSYPPIAGAVAFTVRATSDAPGETPVACTFRAAAAALGNFVPPSPIVSGTTRVSAAFLGVLEAGDNATVQDGIVAIPVHNAGNARANVRVDVVDAGGRTVAPAGAILVDSKVQGATRDWGIVQVRVNGHGSGVVTLLLTPVSTKDASVAGTPLKYQLASSASDCGAGCSPVLSSPMPVAPLLLVGLLAAAVGGRGRKAT